MLDAILSGASLLLTWPAPVFLLAGIALGLCFGAVPGLSGLTGLSMLLPFTFTMDTGPAMAFLLGTFAVTTTSDTLASVLLGVPGTAASQATVLDGYPMAQRGEAPRAFGAAFTASAIGGVLGAIALAVSIPIVTPLIMSFATPEFVMLGLLGLTMVGSLSGESVIKGLAGASFGLLVATIGYAPQGAIARYDFGFVYLLDGLPLIPVVLGLFAIPEIVALSRHGRPIAHADVTGGRSGILDGVRDVIRHRWLMLRCGAIGTYVGMLPGLGGTVVDWVAYGHAVQSSKDKDSYGKGDVRGVIAPETANNAAKGGALLPTLAFGIPGSPPMAILLGAFLIQGLTPGPGMLARNLDVTFSLVWILVIANVVGAGALMIWSKQLARLAHVPGRLLVPGIALFVLMGAWMAGNQMGDWITLLAFGVIGLVMKQAGWSRPAFILGFILSPIIESSLHLATQIHGASWVTRPVCLVIGLLTVCTLVFSALRGRRPSSRGQVETATHVKAETVEPQTARLPSVLLAGCAVATASYAALTSMSWPWDSRYFPLFAAVPLLALACAVLWRDGVALYRLSREVSLAELGDRRDAASLLWLAGIVAASYVFPQAIVIAVAVGGYLLVALHGRWKLALLQAVGGWIVLEFIFGRIGGVLWHPAWIS